ncbi:MAG: N-acetylmuramoyl-L-alanine amidase [Candidatus Sericytochromatia bacterium]|nr:N-acetylmuramoyl-L-alanine amidase [Candidatus Sericytochromatia bacterium]
MSFIPLPRSSSLARRGLNSVLALACALTVVAPAAGATTGSRARDLKQKAGVARTAEAPKATPEAGGARARHAAHARRSTPHGEAAAAGATATRRAAPKADAAGATTTRQAAPRAAAASATTRQAAPKAAAAGTTAARQATPKATAASATSRQATPKATAARKLAPRLVAGAAGLAAATAGGRGPARPGVPAPEPLVIEDLAWRRFGLVLQTSAGFKPLVSVLEHPHRFVIDMPAAEFADPALKRTIQVDQAGIRQVRMSKQGAGVRIVLDCEAAPSFQVMQLRDRSMLVVARAGQEDPGLKALVERFSDEGEAADPAEGQQLAGVWAKEAGDRLTLHVGLSGTTALRYQLFQAQPHQLRLRVPGGAYTGSLPATGRLLRRVEAARKGSTWNLEVTLAEGHYEVSETRDDAGGITLVWERVDPRARDGMPLVVIDPGHGGADPGAVGPSGRTEKAACLGLARGLRDTLRRRGYNAILTRGVDAEVYLAPRLAMIERWQADMFVSLHANSHASHEANGLETFWREPGSQAFAETVHRTVATLLRRPDRGTKQDRLYVLRHATVPSLLLETGFISNPGEERWLDDPAHQGQAAFAIAAGIENFRAAPLVHRPLAAPGKRLGEALIAAMRDCHAP